MGKDALDEDVGARCPFEAVEVLPPRQTTSKWLESGTELEVLAKEIYVGAKYKISWKKVTQVELDAHQGALRIEAENLTVQASGPMHLVQWPDLCKRLLKKWNKLQRKSQRRQERAEEEERLLKETKTKRTTFRRNRTSKASSFLLKNAQNMKEWDSEDDEVFNRLPPKELAKKRQEQAVESEGEEQHPEPDTSENHMDSDNHEDQEDANRLDADEASAQKAPRKRVLRRKRKTKHIQEDSDDDEDLFGEPAVTTPLMARRIVSPATAMRNGDLDDDDDDDDEAGKDGTNEQAKVGSETAATSPAASNTKPTKATTSISSFFQPSSNKANKATTSHASSATGPVEKQPTASNKKKEKKADTSKFFAPRSTAKTESTMPTSTQDNDDDDDDTVMADSMDEDLPKTPPRSASKMSPVVARAYQSAKQLEQEQEDDDDDDTIVDSEDENENNRTQLLAGTSPLSRRLGPQKRRLFNPRRTYGRKPAPSLSTADMALEMAEQQSPKRRRPFAGMDSNPNIQSSSGSPKLSRSPTSRKLVQDVNTVSIPKYRGLKNLGNSCYMNASLQMLYSVPGFMRSIGSWRQGRRLTDSFCMVFEDLQQRIAGAVSPRHIKAAVDAKTDKFRGFQQRDAHEFLGDILDQLHEELQSPAQDGATETDKENRSPGKVEGASATTDTAKSAGQADSVVPTDDFFRMTAEVCLECKSCGYKRTKEEMYRYLSVAIPTKDGQEASKKPSVEECVKHFFQPEDREIKCEKCEEGNVATQTMRIVSRPKALLIHLKRFVVVERPTGEGNEMELAFQKNRAAVNMNVRLSLDEHLKSKEESASSLRQYYSLQSVIHHIGNTANSGHYTADSLREKNQDEEASANDAPRRRQWVSNDDSTAIETSIDQVRRSNQNQRTAYVLLYATASSS